MIFAETEPFWNSQLENAVVVPDYAAWQDRHGALSAQADRLGLPERFATGVDPDQALWRTATGRRTRGLVFIHGGFWRRDNANDYSFVAETAAAADATFYNVDYRLIPNVRMGEVVDDVVLACERAAAETSVLAFVGHSAGAHLAIEAALRFARPPRAVVAISGLYDLEPLRHAFIQNEIALTDAEVREFSPQLRAAAIMCPVHIVAGEDETVEFRRQSIRLFEAIREAGGKSTLSFAPHRHHSSIVADLADRNSGLSKLVQSLLA